MSCILLQLNPFYKLKIKNRNSILLSKNGKDVEKKSG